MPGVLRASSSFSLLFVLGPAGGVGSWELGVALSELRLSYTTCYTKFGNLEARAEVGASHRLAGSALLPMIAN